MRMSHPGPIRQRRNESVDIGAVSDRVGHGVMGHMLVQSAIVLPPFFCFGLTGCRLCMLPHDASREIYNKQNREEGFFFKGLCNFRDPKSCCEQVAVTVAYFSTSLIGFR